MYMINGIGTTLYGKRHLTKKELHGLGLKEMEDLEPYISTMWFCFIFIPLVPLSSHVVFAEYEEEGFFDTDKHYHMVKINLNWNQVLKTGLIPVSILFLLWLWW